MLKTYPHAGSLLAIMGLRRERGTKTMSFMFPCVVLSATVTAVIPQTNVGLKNMLESRQNWTTFSSANYAA